MLKQVVDLMIPVLTLVLYARLLSQSYGATLDAGRSMERVTSPASVWRQMSLLCFAFFALFSSFRSVLFLFFASFPLGSLYAISNVPFFPPWRLNFQLRPLTP